MQGIGFHHPYLHAVPFVIEKVQVDIATLKSEEVYNVSKSVSCSEICILDETACDNNCSNKNVSITIENDGSGTFNIQDNSLLK